MEALVGAKLQTKDGLVGTTELLTGKVVGLYFSAHWCPPCRGFTPKLAEAYTTHLKAKGLEVVFVSSDRDEAAFSEYFAEMPWAALPYDARDTKEALSKRFKVQGIPTFVILNDKGEVITKDGRDAMSKDMTGENFPWHPLTPEQKAAKLGTLLAGELLTKDGTTDFAALDDKVVALYFSAHWCPPCRGFTPQLAAQYAKIVAAGKPFEVVFASSDKDEDAFKEYFGEMPWLAIPYADRKRKEELSEHFGVRGIPSLVLLDTDRSVITTEGRGAVMQSVDDFPFHPKAVGDLAQSASGINDTPSVVVLAETDPAAGLAAEAAMKVLAEEYNAAAKKSGEDPEVRFFIAKGPGGPVPQIRAKCGLPAVVAPHEHTLAEHQNGAGWGCDGCGTSEGKRYRCTQGCDFDYCEACNTKAAEKATLPTQVLLLDLDDNGGYYLPECSPTTDGLRGMLAAFKAKSLERKQM